jgi:GTP cyclohydrolase II
MDLVEAVSVALPTPYGTFTAHAFEPASGRVQIALVAGDVRDGIGVLARLHSECLTGDALGSLRCDCGVQLRQSLRRVAAEGRGVVVYATGQEGRGIGLVNKLRAYVLQDDGADTVDANHALGLPADSRNYAESAAVFEALGICSIRLLTNNPGKADGLRAWGTVVDGIVALPTSPQHRNARYLATKSARMGHRRPAGPVLEEIAGASSAAIDVLGLLGRRPAPADRPMVVLKYAQTLDGRIATASGDARWISGTAERQVSHALRAACDAVLVGVGTVVRDDPQLTVRMVPGASPVRVVVDSTLRLPPNARVLAPDASTTVITTDRSALERRAELRDNGVTVHVVAGDQGRVDLRAGLAALRAAGIDVVLVEGGTGMITGLLRAGVVDRVITAIAPLIIGEGTPAVADLAVDRIAAGIRLTNRSIVPVDDDVLLAWDVAAGEASSNGDG